MKNTLRSESKRKNLHGFRLGTDRRSWSDVEQYLKKWQVNEFGHIWSFCHLGPVWLGDLMGLSNGAWLSMPQRLHEAAKWAASANLCPGVAKVKAWQLKPSSKCGNPELDIDEFGLFLPIFHLVFRCVSISMCFGQAKCPREFVDAVTVGFENRLASNKAVPVAAHARVGALTLHARPCSLMVLSLSR